MIYLVSYREIRGYGLLAQKDDKGRLNYYLHNAHGDVTIDFEGNVGILITPHVGLGSPNASIGLTASITSADTIYDLKGIGFEVGASVLVVGAEYVLGDGYYGGNLNGGACVAPFEGHTDLTYTFLIPLRNDQSEEAKTEALSTFKQIYDNMSYADKKLLSDLIRHTEDIFEIKKDLCVISVKLNFQVRIA